jgi:hypothetical protein
MYEYVYDSAYDFMYDFHPNVIYCNYNGLSKHFKNKIKKLEYFLAGYFWQQIVHRIVCKITRVDGPIGSSSS